MTSPTARTACALSLFIHQKLVTFRAAVFSKCALRAAQAADVLADVLGEQLELGEGARERAGLPPNTGPWRVVTPWAMYDYNANRKLRLIATAPWVTIEQVLAECEYPPVVTDEVATLEGPTDEELQILRAELDPRGQNTGERSNWIIFNGERYTRAE